MLYKNVNIESFGYEVPPITVSSEAIEKRLEPVYKRLHLPEGRLEMMTGIKERHFWKPNTLPSDGAILAGRKALKTSSIPREKIRCLVMCSVCRDFLEPATATVVHSALQLSKNALVFDISNACLGVLSGMITVANMIELGHIEAGLIVAGENSRPLVESTIKTIIKNKKLTRKTIKPYFASLTIGSAAVGVMLAHRDISNGGHKLIGGSSLAVTSYNNLCQGNKDRGMKDNASILMNTDSELLMHKGVEVAAETWNIFKKETDWKNETIDCVCTHQVGIAHKKFMFEMLKLDPSKDFSTLSFLGNVGSVSCPITTAMAVENKRIKPGDKVAMLGIGSGINCTMLGIEW